MEWIIGNIMEELFSDYLELVGKYEDWDDFIESKTDEALLIEKYGEVK